MSPADTDPSATPTAGLSTDCVRSRLAIIGNGGGGKTTLAKQLGGMFDLPVYHVDSIQYIAGMQVRELDETRAILDALAAEERWVLDGFGPMDVIERRFHRATRIVFVDFPLWRHYAWAAKRQVTSLWRTRAELPAGCSEAGLGASLRMFRILWRVHHQIRPRLLELLSSAELRDRVTHVRNLSDWRRVHRGQLERP